jgi:hypothetical protein
MAALRSDTLGAVNTEPTELLPSRKKRSHAWIDARSLALARAVAAKIRRNPSFLQRASDNLVRWKERHSTWPRCLSEWEEILSSRTLDDVLAILLEDSEDGRRRRQSSPFTGILTPAERREIFERYEATGT